MKKPPYPRPQKLSDPGYDFRPDSLRALLAVPDEKLEWHHYKDFLGPFLPAGTYEESVYFLPGAFKMLQEEQEHGLDLTTSVIWFASENAAQLEADGLLESCRNEITNCLQKWTQIFEVLHFDKDACMKKEWVISYFDYVRNVEEVCETLCDLDRFEKHGDLADEFLESLVQSTATPVQSAWFLELVRAQEDVRPPPSRPFFLSLFANQEILIEKQLAVENFILKKTPSPTYWRDTFKAIGLTD
jgi:hypothetical protein